MSRKYLYFFVSRSLFVRIHSFKDEQVVVVNNNKCSWVLFHSEIGNECSNISKETEMMRIG